MKLKLEVFTETVLLSVSGDLHARNAQVLSAGLQRILSLQVPYVFIDLTQASIPDDTLPLIQQVKSTFKSESNNRSESKGGLYLIGKDKRVCDFQYFFQAAGECPSSETASLIEKLQLESELQSLKEKKRSLELKEKTGDPAPPTATGDAAADAAAAEAYAQEMAANRLKKQENQRLQRMNQWLESEANRHEALAKTLQKGVTYLNSKKPPSSSAPQENTLPEIETKLREILRNKGLL
jgi:hypothetical protein